jgi:hypothetical protein
MSTTILSVTREADRKILNPTLHDLMSIVEAIRSGDKYEPSFETRMENGFIIEYMRVNSTMNGSLIGWIVRQKQPNQLRSCVLARMNANFEYESRMLEVELCGAIEHIQAGCLIADELLGEWIELEFYGVNSIDDEWRKQYRWQPFLDSVDSTKLDER